MSEGSAQTKRGMGLAPMVAGGVLSVGLLGGLGWAAVNIPGALSTPPASAPAGPADGGYQPAPTQTQEPHTPGEEHGVEDSADEDGDVPVEDQDEGASEEEADGSADSDPDTDPDRDSDQNDDAESAENQSHLMEADIIYQVEEGDTLAAISDEFGISVDMLAEYNEISDVHTIYRESKILVPYSEVSVSLDFVEN